MLVIAPHPDDDVLGVGSSIAGFRAEGVPVFVVFLTSGDANLAGQRLVTMHPFRVPADFRALGSRRQKEAVVALGRLGVAPADALFLNYPDRGLAALLSSHWSQFQPYRSPYTARDAKYSPVALNPGEPYCGESLLAELETILRTFRPTIVYLPHPLDTHPDHRAAYAFVQRAVADLASKGGELGEISLRCYTVHSYIDRLPSRLRSETAATESFASFFGVGDWHTTEVSADAVAAKYRALRAHASQWWTCGGFLSRFLMGGEPYMVETE